MASATLQEGTHKFVDTINNNEKYSHLQILTFINDLWALFV